MLQRDNRSTERAIPFCLTACFLVLAIWFIGLSFGDDSFYMWTGDYIKPSGLFGSQDWSPLYCLWFKLIGCVVHNPIARYFTSWGLLVVAASLLPTLARLRSAWIYSFLILCIPFLTAYPYVGLFSGVIFLCGTCLVLRRSWSLPALLALACLFCAVVSFSRPEFSISVYLCAVATLLALTFRRAGQRMLSATPEPPRSLLANAAIVITVLTLSTLIFFVFTRAHSTRSGLAFAQHYNRRAADRGLIPKGPGVWAIDYAEKSFGIDTGHNAANGTASMGDFLRANPKLFFGHLLSNLADPRTLVLLFALVALILWPWLSRSKAQLRPASLWLALLALAPLTAIIVIYPRDHYALIVLPSLLLYATQLIRPDQWIRPSLPWAISLGCALIWFLNIGLPQLRNIPASLERVNLPRAECIRQSDRSTDANNPNAFDITSMPGVYLVHPRTLSHSTELADWPHFTQWATTTHPAWVSMTAYPSPPYNKTPAEVDAFLSGVLGYTAHPCPREAYLTLYTRGSR